MFIMLLDCASWVLVVLTRSVIKLRLENHIFIFLTYPLKQPAGGASYYARRLIKPNLSWFILIIVKLLQAFRQNFEYGKMQVSVNKTFKNLPLQNYQTGFLFGTQIVLGYVLYTFGQMVAPPTLLVK